MNYTEQGVLAFVQLGFDLSYGVPDTLESSSILIYLETHMGLYTQNGVNG